MSGKVPAKTAAPSKVSKVYRAMDVCEIAQLQPYVLRSWEHEFPTIGVQKSPEGPRLYRQSDLDQVLRIKELVFGEGLTLAGARRRIDASAPAPEREAAVQKDVAEVLDALTSDARTRIAYVRDGLRSILRVLSSAAGTVVVVDDFQLVPPKPVGKGQPRAAAGRAGGAKQVGDKVARKTKRRVSA